MVDIRLRISSYVGLITVSSSKLYSSQQYLRRWLLRSLIETINEEM